MRAGGIAEPAHGLLVQDLPRRSTCTDAFWTHCARSLSGDQIETFSTRGSAVASAAAEASASSASSSTIGQTTTPIAASAERMELGEERRLDPLPVL